MDIEKLDKKSSRIKNMFNSISHRYDFLNHFLSLGTDIYWRKRSVKIIKSKNRIENPLILDLCCGTGDFSLQFAKMGNVIGVDFAEGMLRNGLEKVKGKRIYLTCGDALLLPFRDDIFDIVSIAFGVRNFENLERGLLEIRRVLKKGGIVAILEFSSPESRFIKKTFSIYFHKILPFLGNLISKSDFAYSYLPQSVSQFPSHKKMKKILEDLGFKKVTYKLFFTGISALYIGEK